MYWSAVYTQTQISSGRQQQKELDWRFEKNLQEKLTFPKQLICDDLCIGEKVIEYWNPLKNIKY